MPYELEAPTRLAAAKRTLVRDVIIGLGTAALIGGLIVLALGIDVQSAANSIASGCVSNPLCQLNTTAYADDSARAAGLIIVGIIFTAVGGITVFAGIRRPKATFRPPSEAMTSRLTPPPGAYSRMVWVRCTACGKPVEWPSNSCPRCGDLLHSYR